MDLTLVFLNFLHLFPLFIRIHQTYFISIEQFFKNRSISCGKRTNYTRQIIIILIELNLDISFQLVPLRFLLALWMVLFNVGLINFGIAFNQLIHLLPFFENSVVLLGTCSSFHLVFKFFLQ
jgi:hypothetical protein